MTYHATFLATAQFAAIVTDFGRITEGEALQIIIERTRIKYNLIPNWIETIWANDVLADGNVAEPG